MSLVRLDDISNIVVVGDLHLNSSTPQSRIDDYGDTCLKKLKQVLRICRKNNYELVVLTGDIFHKNKQPMKFINKVVEIFKRFRDSGISVYSITGNHDLAYDKIEYLNQSPLGNLLVSGIVDHLDELKIKSKEGYNIYLKGFDFSDKVESVKEDISSTIKICVAHRYFERFDREFLNTKNIKELGYDIYLLGHDHVSYKPKRIDNSYLLRPGSLLRGSSHDYQLERDVVLDVIKFNGSKERPKLSFGREKLDISDAEQVFTKSVFNKKEDQDREERVLSSISEGIDDLLSKMEDMGDENSIYKYLDTMDIEDSVKERIEMYLSNYGIYRMGV